MSKSAWTLSKSAWTLSKKGSGLEALDALLVIKLPWSPCQGLWRAVLSKSKLPLNCLHKADNRVTSTTTSGATALPCSPREHCRDTGSALDPN